MTTTFAFARDLDDEPPPVTLDDAYAAIRGVVEENKRLRAEVRELRAGPAGTFAEAIDLIRDQARDSEGVIDTVHRLIEGQSEPAPTLTPERAAIADDAAESTARMLAAIEAQAREGETPDQTVERIIWERDGLRKNFYGAIADLRETERERERLRTRNEQLRADVAKRGAKLAEQRKALDAIGEEVACFPGTKASAVAESAREAIESGDAAKQALSFIAGTVGLDSDAPAAHIIAAVELLARDEGPDGDVETLRVVRQVDAELTAAAEERAQLLATIQTAIPAIRAGINALGSSEVDVRSRNAARESLHALEAAVEGAEPAAVLSAAPICDSCGTDDHPEHGCAGSAYGKPECLASEGAA